MPFYDFRDLMEPWISRGDPRPHPSHNRSPAKGFGIAAAIRAPIEGEPMPDFPRTTAPRRDPAMIAFQLASGALATHPFLATEMAMAMVDGELAQWRAWRIVSFSASSSMVPPLLRSQQVLDLIEQGQAYEPR